MIEYDFDWYLTDRFGKKIFFIKNQIVIGRKDCDIQLKSTSVDYKHCILSINEKDKQLRIKDLKTSNGTFVNDQPIDFDDFHVLHVGDKIRLAYDQITFTVSNKIPIATPGSPTRGSDIPCVVTDPERSMTSALCELSDSIVDLNTSSDPQVDVYQVNNDDTSDNGDNIVPEPEPPDRVQDNQHTKIDQSIYSSKPAESFTFNFDGEEATEKDNGSTYVTRFAPSKLRSSFEERDKMKRKKLLPTKSTSKSDNVLTKNTETPRIGIVSGRVRDGNTSNTKTLNVRPSPKPEDKSSFRSKNLANKSKILGTEKIIKSKPASQSSQNPVIERNETTKIKQSRTSKISTPTLTKPNSKSNSSEKIPTENPQHSSETSIKNKRPSLSTEGKVISSKFQSTEQSTPTSKVNTPPLRKRNSNSYVLEPKPIEVELNNDVQIDPPPLMFPSFTKQNSKSLLTGKFPIDTDTTGDKIEPLDELQSPVPMVFQTFTKRNSKSLLSEKLPIDTDNITEQQSPIPMAYPTFSKKNSKSYLLEKMLLGDDLSVDFLTYEQAKTTDDNIPVSTREPISLVEMDLKGSTGNLSETGTYVIDDVVDDKTVNLYDSDDTLAKDNSSSVSSNHLNSDTELESKSSGKWLSEFPDDDVTMNCDSKSKRIINSKFTGTSMPHIANEEYFQTNKRDNFRDDEHSKSNFNCLVTDNRHRISRNPNCRSTDDDNNNKRNSSQNPMDCPQQLYDANLQNAYSSYSNIAYSIGNESNTGAEDFYVPDVIPKSTVPSNSCNQVSNLQHKRKESDHYKSPQINSKHHPRSTFSVSSLDTALLLQDTEALLNDMEKRVYSRKDKRDDTSKSQGFSTSISHGEKIPFVDEADEKEEDSSLFSYPNETDENLRSNAIKPQLEQTGADDKSRSYVVRSPINSGNIRRNNSCKLGISESMTLSRKLNSTLRNQRSCSMIEEQRLNQVSNNNNNNYNNNNNNNNNNNPELFNDYRSKSKPSVLAMNSGIFMNRRGSAGISSALNSPVSRLEPGAFFNNGFSVQRPKDVFPYFSTNLLSLHRQRFNRYEYGQHSLKYNSNSTTMLCNKYNNTSPPWNGEDTTVSPNSFYPTYDTEYYAYNTMPDPLDASSMLLSKHDHNLAAANHNNNSQVHVSNLELNPDIDYNKREDIGDYSQPCNASGRSSAFSPVNSLHQSTESVNNYQMASKSRSSIGLNEQKHCSYDTLLVSSVHRYSARLCRYTEEIVHRMRREGSDYQNNSPVDTVFDQSESFGQLKSVNRELQETVSNLRSLEKQLQKVERLLFPTEKSGRNSTAGSCTEDNYLNQLERINKELKDFVPIDDPVSGGNKSSNAKVLLRGGEYSYLSPVVSKESKDTPAKSLEQSTTINKNSNKTPSDVGPSSKSKYCSISKRFQHRKE